MAEMLKASGSVGLEVLAHLIKLVIAEDVDVEHQLPKTLPTHFVASTERNLQLRAVCDLVSSNKNNG